MVLLFGVPGPRLLLQWPGCLAGLLIDNMFAIGAPAKRAHTTMDLHAIRIMNTLVRSSLHQVIDSVIRHILEVDLAPG